MKDEEIRIAVAAACGWRDVKHEFVEHSQTMEITGVKPGYPDYVNPARYDTPNYPSDLNAAHEMEKMLNEPQQNMFLDYLVFAISRSMPNPNESVGWTTVHATARQRCEAFLRTLNLWKE